MKTEIDLHELTKELLGEELANLFEEETGFSITAEKSDFCVTGLDITVPKIVTFKLKELRINTKGVVSTGFVIYLAVQVVQNFEALWQGIPSVFLTP